MTEGDIPTDDVEAIGSRLALSRDGRPPSFQDESLGAKHDTS